MVSLENVGCEAIDRIQLVECSTQCRAFFVNGNKSFYK